MRIFVSRNALPVINLGAVKFIVVRHCEPQLAQLLNRFFPPAVAAHLKLVLSGDTQLNFLACRQLQFFSHLGWNANRQAVSPLRIFMESTLQIYAIIIYPFPCISTPSCISNCIERVLLHRRGITVEAHRPVRNRDRRHFPGWPFSRYAVCNSSWRFLWR